MKFLYITLPLLAFIGALMVAAPLFAMPTNLTTATDVATPINATMGLDERGDVPLWICSWKLGEGSPANYHYGKWCDASREDDRTGISPVWHCNDRSRNWVADMGQIPINHGILRFRAACPTERDHGWGWQPFRQGGGCYSEHWAVCLGTANPGEKDIKCYWKNKDDDCTWPDVFRVGEGPKLVSIWGQTR